MVTIEQIDELRKRMKVSYEEAKEALEQSNGDLLEAIIYIEKNSTTNRSNADGHSSQEETCESDGFSRAISSFIAWCKKIIKKGNSNFIVISKKDSVVLKLSLTIFVIILVIIPYITLPLLLIALFTNHRFSCIGKDLENTKANETLNKMSQAADNIKDEFVK